MTELIASTLVGFFAFVGLLVSICAGLIACAKMISVARWYLHKERALWQHQDAVLRAVAEWKERNPERVAELGRMRDDIQG